MKHKLKYWLIFLISFLSPIGIGVALQISGVGENVIQNRFLHSAILILVCVLSLYIAYFAYNVYQQKKEQDIFFISLAYVAMGFGFLMHGVFLPDLVFSNEKIFDITEHYGLFIGSFILLAILIPFDLNRERLHKMSSAILSGFIFINILGISGLIFIEALQELLYTYVDLVTALTALFFFASFVRLFLKYTHSPSTLLLFYTSGLAVLVSTGIAPFFYKEWSVLWWYFHILILIGFFIFFISAVLTKGKEKTFDLLAGRKRVIGRISTKLFIAFIVVGFLPMLFLNVINNQNNTEILSKEISRNITILAEAKEGQVFQYIKGLKMRTIDFSSDGFIREKMYEILKKDSKENKDALEKHLVKNKLSLDTHLLGIILLDTKGQVIVATEGLDIQKDHSQFMHFTMGSKGVFVMTRAKDEPVHYSERITFMVSTPVTDKDTGGFVGVLVNVFSTENINKTLSGQFQLTEGALTGLEGSLESLKIYMVNSDRNIFAYTDYKNVHVNNDIKQIKVDTVPVRRCLVEGVEIHGEMYEDYNGVRVVGTSMCLVDLGLTLLVEVDEKDAFLPLDESRDKSNILLWMSSIIMFIGAVVVSSIFSRPIRGLTEAAREIGKGNLDQQVPVETDDELGELGNAFNSMVSQVKETRISLKENAEERDRAAKKLEVQNKTLTEARLAIINLLEDIEKEKEKAEGLVEVRTRELTAEKARLLASINSLSFGFIIADMSHGIILKNKASDELFGLNTKKDTAIKDTVTLLGEHFDIVAESHCLKGAAICESKEIVFDKKFLRISISPIFVSDDDNGAIGYVLVLEDITEAKSLERTRDEFFAIASHEMRTPLTAIRGNMSLIKDLFLDKIKNADVKEMIDDTYEASVRLIGIVNDFLDVSRLEQGKLTLNKENVDLVAMIEKAVQKLSVLAESKKLSLKFESKDVDMPVLADSERVKQVIFNLISNAINYTPEGSVSVDVIKEDNFIKVSVTDTGRGVSEQNQSLLFHKFQQAGEKILARDVTKSTGLGLYISKMLIESMGGKIWLEKSELGKGSTFAFTLPISS